VIEIGAFLSHLNEQFDLGTVQVDAQALALLLDGGAQRAGEVHTGVGMVVGAPGTYGERRSGREQGHSVPHPRLDERIEVSGAFDHR